MSFFRMYTLVASVLFFAGFLVTIVQHMYVSSDEHNRVVDTPVQKPIFEFYDSGSHYDGR